MAKCKGKKDNGQRCGANAGPSGYCFWHDDDAQAEVARQAASAKGGKGGRLAPLSLEESEVKDITFDAARDITGFCARVAKWVLSGQIDAKAGNCAILAASTALRSLDVGEFEARLKQLEQQLGIKGAA